MTTQLRSYIAPGAPATRTPCDGSESALRIEFGFTPRWYQKHLGIDFSNRWHVDPIYRGETVTAMRRELHRRFPSLFPAAYPIPAMNLDGVHGALVVCGLFGIPGEYYADNWPAARHAYLSEEAIAALEKPSLADMPMMAQVFEQMDTIERECGQITGYLNWQGVLNNAYRLRGPELFADMLMNPGLARHLFEVIAETMIAGMRLVYARQAQTGVRIRHSTVSNCLVNMVSPELYREHLLPWDKHLAQAFPAFGIHNCAWNADPYIDDYATVEPLGYIDMGVESDLARARERCPNARRALMYTPKDLHHKSPDELRNDLARIARDYAPCDIVMADIDYETPDERVLFFAKLAEEVMTDSPQ
jgi:hypothetical protein